MNNTQACLNEVIQKYKLQQASRNYFELITRKEMIIPFVNTLNSIGIKITRMTLWCHVNGSNPDCPHGMGGPWNWLDEDWFSEMCHWNEVEFSRKEPAKENNAQYVDFFFNVFPQEQRFLSCIVPAFELDVPEDWTYAQYTSYRGWHSPPLFE